MKRAVDHKTPLRAAVAVLALLSMAPTPGDIGGCGQPAEDLDAKAFFSSMRATDCQRCQACGFSTASCDDACGRKTPLPTGFGEGCAPLAHDGEVCLRRLTADSCGDYERYVQDSNGASVPLEARPRPLECQFCPPR